jgi:hypothetical protein
LFALLTNAAPMGPILKPAKHKPSPVLNQVAANSESPITGVIPYLFQLVNPWMAA